MEEKEINELAEGVDNLSVGIPSLNVEGREVAATHFEILGMKDKYKYYGVTKCEKGIATYPLIRPMKKEKSVTFEYGGGMEASVVDLDKFPFCCLWREETSTHLTQVFFLCKDIKGKDVRKVLLKGGDTSAMLPKIQNNYKSGTEKYPGDKLKFNNIALCGDWPNGEGDAGWTLDRVMHLKPGETGVTLGEDIPVYHVTNVPAPNPLVWDNIRALPRESVLYDYHGALPDTLPVCFVSSTLYDDRLPNMSMYPSNGTEGEYYHRIKIPVLKVAQKLPRMFFWCSAPSDKGVGQMHFICGDKAKHGKIIRGVLKNCISMVPTRTSFPMSVFNDYENGIPKKTYNIIAVPQ